MANAKFNLQSELGGVTTITPSDTANNGTVVIPESGTLVNVDTAVTDNAIARYNGTTGIDMGNTPVSNVDVGVEEEYKRKCLEVKAKYPKDMA